MTVTASGAKEDQTSREVLLDYMELELTISSSFVVEPGLWNSRSKLRSERCAWHHLHFCEIHIHGEDYETSPAFINVELSPETKVRWRTETVSLLGPPFSNPAFEYSQPLINSISTLSIGYLLSSFHPGKLSIH